MTGIVETDHLIGRVKQGFFAKVRVRVDPELPGKRGFFR